MADFTQWCFNCQKKLQHEGLYCSKQCRHEDSGINEADSLFFTTASPTVSRASSVYDAFAIAEFSVESDSRRSSVTSTTSTLSGDFANVHSILSPAFSLEFKSRKRRN
ncbi:hypothetical protein BDR26DRAFT_901060 [Obelidium mucronatum]|nr:hypothetical protein BDR26DRAFT_901060 [Obelidium mucronatum]